jgi:hypothetical protein
VPGSVGSIDGRLLGVDIEPIAFVQVRPFETISPSEVSDVV